MTPGASIEGPRRSSAARLGGEVISSGRRTSPSRLHGDSEGSLGTTEPVCRTAGTSSDCSVCLPETPGTAGVLASMD